MLRGLCLLESSLGRINSEISLLTEQIRFGFLSELLWAQGWELQNVGVGVQELFS